MRVAFTLLVIFVGTTLTASAADEKYKSKDGKFAIQFPSGAKVETDMEKDGDLVMNMAKVEMNDKIFAVMFTDLKDAVKSASPKVLLDGLEKGFVSTSGAKVASSKEISYGKDKFPGREVVLDKDGAKIKVRFLIAGSHAYIVAKGGMKDFALGKEEKNFLAS